MINKDELKRMIVAISYDILDEVVSPVCHIPKGGIVANVFLADLGCYTIGDEEEEKQLDKELRKRYSLDEHVDLPMYVPVASIALSVILFGHYTKGGN